MFVGRRRGAWGLRWVMMVTEVELGSWVTWIVCYIELRGFLICLWFSLFVCADARSCLCLGYVWMLVELRVVQWEIARVGTPSNYWFCVCCVGIHMLYVGGEGDCHSKKDSNLESLIDFSKSLCVWWVTFLVFVFSRKELTSLFLFMFVYLCHCMRADFCFFGIYFKTQGVHWACELKIGFFYIWTIGLEVLAIVLCGFAFVGGVIDAV